MESLRAWMRRLPDEDAGIHEAFVRVEIEGRLTQYRRASRAWRIVQIGIWIATALLGLLGSALAALKTGEVVAVVAGSMVATLTTFAHAAHPGQKADGFEMARRTIRDDIWNLLNRMGEYKVMPVEIAFENFASQLHEIVVRKRTVTNLELD